MSREEIGCFYVERKLTEEDIREAVQLHKRTAMELDDQFPNGRVNYDDPKAQKIWKREHLSIRCLPFVSAMYDELQGKIEETTSDGRKSEIHFGDVLIPDSDTIGRYSIHTVKACAIVALCDPSESKPGEYFIMPSRTDYMGDPNRLLLFETADIGKNTVAADS